MAIPSKQTLLEKAKSLKHQTRNRVISTEEMDLALAWARDEISITQVSKVLGKQSANAYIFLSLAFRAYIQKGH